MLTRIFAAVAVLLAVTVPARAALVTDTFEFTASNFDSNNPAIFPAIDPLKGSFTLTFNPTVPSSGITTTGLTLNSLNIANLAYPTAYEYSFGGAGLVIGSWTGSVLGDIAGHNSFYLEIAGIDVGNPTFFAAFYSIDGLTNTYFGTNTGTLDLVSQTSTVPLPAALPLFGTALAGLGGVGWLRRRKV